MLQQPDGRWAVSPDEATALQAVADRVSSWQDGAEGGVIHEEFARVSHEVGLDVPDELANALCDEIEHGARPPGRLPVRHRHRVTGPPVR